MYNKSHKSCEKFAALAFSPYLCEVNLWCHDDSALLSTCPPISNLPI